MTTFPVDDVQPATQPLATSPLASRFADALAVGGDPAIAVIDHRRVHPLLAAVGLAFAEHRPLVLSPDAVWLTIAQGVAQHVRLNAEQLRGRLVRHQGKQRLEIERAAMPVTPADWQSAIGALRDRLAGEIGDGRARVFECDFSTSSDVDRVASQVVLLDAYSPYFSYWMTAVCGIPEITLLGTPDDWRRIRERLDVIAELDLEWWCRSLRPITEHFARAASGDVDRAFWQRIYNPSDAYGGEVVTGWITRLYPYLSNGLTVATQNPMLDLPIDEPKQRTVKGKTTYDGPGIRSDSVPATLSRAPLRFIDHATQTVGIVDLVAGVVAVAQDPRGALCPISGWHVERGELRMADVIDRIVAEHESTPPDPANTHRNYGMQGSAEVVELFSRLERATLFAGARRWDLELPIDVRFEERSQWYFRRVARLGDGTSLCSAMRFGGDREPHWVLCRVEAEQRPDDPMLCVHAIDKLEDVRVLAGTLTSILDAALESGGDISSLVVGSLVTRA